MAINSKALHEFYAGKKVLITGHTGFKGSWMALWLNEMGASVCGYALDPLSEKDNFNVSRVGSVIHDIRADIRDLEKLKAVISDEAPDLVFHLAAQALVIQSYKEPVSTYETNIMGTVNLLEACRVSEKKRSIVVVTSDKCYENKEWIFPYRENDPMGGFDPYSSSKGATELVCAAYRNSYFLSSGTSKQRLATARAGNVIGGGDWSDNRLIPDCIRAIEKHEPLLLRFPGATRPWQHVLEPLYGYLLLGMKNYQSEHYDQGWNFGPGVSGTHTVREVVEEVFSVLGEGRWEQEGVPGFHEAKLLALDISKSFNLLNWKPTLNFKETLKLTAEWYQHYRSNPDMREFCKSQIRYFENHED